MISVSISPKYSIILWLVWKVWLLVMLDTAELKKKRLYLGKIETEFKNSVDRLSAAHSLYLRCSSHAIRTLHSLTVLTIINYCSDRNFPSLGKLLVWIEYNNNKVLRTGSGAVLAKVISIYCSLQPVFLFTSLWPSIRISPRISAHALYQGREILQ